MLRSKESDRTIHKFAIVNLAIAPAIPPAIHPASPRSLGTVPIHSGHLFRPISDTRSGDLKKYGAPGKLDRWFRG